SPKARSAAVPAASSCRRAGRPRSGEDGCGPIRRGVLSGAASMTDLSLTILPETPGDALAIERLHERTFGPGRFARTAFGTREGGPHQPALWFTARVGPLLVGSGRLTPIRIGEPPALLLGPLTVEPPFRDRGIGLVLMRRAMAQARERGH